MNYCGGKGTVVLTLSNKTNAGMNKNQILSKSTLDLEKNNVSKRSYIVLATYTRPNIFHIVLPFLVYKGR